MSRRLAAVLLAAATLVPGAGVLTSPASAVDCFTWTDPKNDSAAPNAAATSPVTNEVGLDLTGVTMDSTGGELKITISVNDLAESKAQKAQGGDRFAVRFVVGAGKAVAMTFTRDAQGAKSQTYTVDGAAKTPLPTAAWDHTANTVTATVAMADFTAATGATTGTALRAMWAEARNLYASPQVGSAQWDTAYAPDWNVHVLGTPCTGPTPEPAYGLPIADCNVLTDPKGDAKISPPIVALNGGGPDGPENDPDLDVVGVVGETTADEVRLYLRVDKLAALPARGNGHVFEAGFMFNGKDISIDAAEHDSVGYALYVYRPRIWVGTTDKTANAAPRVKFDRTKSMVIFSVDRASLETLVGAPVPAGAELTSVYGRSYVAIAPSLYFFPVDEAPNTTAAEDVYKVGNNGCFRPPASKLTSLLASAVQYGDKANVSAKLTTDSGSVLPGKTVKFAVGSESVTAVTDAAGVARAQLGTAKTAGTHTMTVSFAGDSTADNSSATAPYNVVLEKTRVALAVAKSGSARTVTATLKDDDGRAIRGQKINWYINGKKVSTATTNTAGQVVLKTAKPTQTVVAEFLTVAGKYSGSKATAKV